MATKKSATRKTAAEKNGTTKAQSIRDTARELGTNARPKEIIAALAAKGVSVSYTLIGSTLGKRQVSEEHGKGEKVWRQLR